MTSKYSNCLFIITLFFISFFIFDINNSDFNWMAFQERDFDKAANFLLENKLSYLGPETSGGGYLPGPFLTLIYLIPVIIFKEPIGIFLFLQFCFLLNIVISFYLLKKYYSTGLAWISFFLILTSSSMYMHVYSAWHAAIAPTLFLISLVTIDRAVSKLKNYWFFITGIIFGISVQVHASSLLFIMLTLILILVIKKKQKFNVLIIILSGFLTTFIYYFLQDYNLDYKNSLTILQKINLDKILNWSPQDKDGINHIDFLNLYFSRMIYGSFDAFKVYYQAAFDGINIYKFILSIGVFKIIFLLIGLSSILLSNKNKLLNYFQILLILSPIFFWNHQSRWFMFAHPFFEIIISYGILQTIIKANNYIQKTHNLSLKIDTFIPIFTFSTIIVILFSSLITNIIKEDLNTRIIPPDSGQYSSFSIYYNPYKNQIKIRDFLLNELKLDPKDYKNKFYFYRGDKNWIFDATYQLPSWAHYKYLFQSRDIKKTMNLGKNGIIVLPKKFKKNIDLTNLDIIQTKEYNDFIIIIYKSSYFYKTIPLYSNFLEDEIKINELKEDKSKISIDKNSIKINYYAFIDTHFKSPIKFINKLYLKNNKSDLEGFFEIQGPNIRQSAFNEQAPHFIKNPQIILKFKDGSSYQKELFSKNLYSKQDGIDKRKSHIFYGKNYETKHLGSLFHDAPYGMEIKLKNINVNSIKEVIFKIDGYGDFINYDTENQKKTIKKQKNYIIKLKVN